MKYFAIFVFSFTLFSCVKSGSPWSVIDDSEIKDITLANDDKIYYHDYIEDVEIIPLGPSGKVMVGMIDKIIVTNDNIVISDSHSAKGVFIFGRDGKYQAAINRQGRGPQEYLELRDMAMLPDNKTIAILDNRGRKVLYFSLDGQFISSTAITFLFNGFEYITDNNIVCSTYGVGDDDPGLRDQENPFNLLWFTDKDFKIEGTAMPERYNRDERIVKVPNLYKYGDNVYTHRPYSDTICQVTDNGLKAAYRVNMDKIDGISNPDPKITKAEFDMLRKEHATFSGSFTDSDNYVWLSVSTPPDNIMGSYLYSKITGKSYLLGRDYNNIEDFIRRLSLLPDASMGEKFVTIHDAYSILMIGGEDIDKHHPELAGLTEESNPVVILYSFKEGL